ncbi:hypothetical protein P168DRAFT_317875 [Aspergillus campestris IBT 28561]|uniref:Uncharacterized protein n=1 Tax=Aspergillus campestris (strain IBT 28561) TaxID=1392248 RepID=A0A2I1D4M9_ASPC2|nr:uncharacterized protein P168DRAFT_317875 [Aspergillus campestris IBT 28561]PKY04832.1 hypothetical protein P168DRAFT_317875 [Aspergillus campestris IBT 28561]
MGGSHTNLNPEAPEFVYHGGKPSSMGIPGEDVSTKDAEQGDNDQSFDEPRASLQGGKLTGEPNDVWTHAGDSSSTESENGISGIVEDNRDETQNNLIAMAGSKSAAALYFNGPRESWLAFQLPDAGFLPEQSHFTHGGIAVCFRISDRNVASKLSVEVFVTKANSNAKRALHPGNVVHSACLDFTLHISESNQPRCIQSFAFSTHFPIRKGGKVDEITKVEYEDPCYVDIEFTTTGGVSHGLLDPCVTEFDDQG